MDLKESGTPIGMCGLLKRDWLADVDIGFALLPRFWAKGYAFEAASSVLAHAQRRGPEAGRGHHLAGQRGLDGPLAKLGFRFEGVARASDKEAEVKVFGREA